MPVGLHILHHILPQQIFDVIVEDVLEGHLVKE